jgi:hypothetical protein
MIAWVLTCYLGAKQPVILNCSKLTNDGKVYSCEVSKKETDHEYLAEEDRTVDVEVESFEVAAFAPVEHCIARRRK